MTVMDSELEALIDRIADEVVERVASLKDRPLYSPNSLAEKLQLTPRTVRKMLADGVIPSFVIGESSRRVDPADVDAYLERRKAAR